ncbi:MAG: hypothetical protein QGG14_02865 [Planctomycetota bacterium]|nr:hypothetical protein [Planctomycetota bacterium]
MTTHPAHAIDIERCTECPLVGTHTKQDKSVPCCHPLRMAIERLEVNPWKSPPKHCPHRTQLTVLRVTS